MRSGEALGETMAVLNELAALPPSVAEPGPPSWETSNLLHLGQVLTLLASRREETRGGHVRLDHPDQDDERWLVRQSVDVGPDGIPMMSERPADGKGRA